MRKSLEDTWRELEARGQPMPRLSSGRPSIAPAMPNYDDEVPRFSFFRHIVRQADYSNFTLPRTYFGRSLLQGVTFANTELTESRMCWNDFEDCDFSGADLTRCDMRASIYKRCKFVGANLTGADLRRSNFEECDFTAAKLIDAVIVLDFEPTGIEEHLTEEERLRINWTEDFGPEPDGG